MDRSLFQQLAVLDWVGLFLVGSLLVMGLVRGLWWQAIRLVGVLAAMVVARLFATDGAAWLLGEWPEMSPRLAHGVAWVGLFAGTLATATLLGHLGQRLLEALQLGPANRLAGGLAGALTGLSIHLALLLGLTLIASEDFVHRHVVGTYSERLYRTVGDRWQVVLGAEAAEELERLLGGKPDPEPPAAGEPPHVR